jgi:Zn-dependent protease with chaperone function
MSIFVLLLVIGIMVHGEQPAAQLQVAMAWWSPLGMLVPKCALAGLYWMLCRWTFHRMGGPGTGRRLRWTDRASQVYRATTLILYVGDLKWGMLTSIRQQMGNYVLVDELLVMLPSMLLIMFSWWAYYPIDRRLREAVLMRELDKSKPVRAIWTRGQFLLAQFRHQIASLLVPLGLLMAFMETVSRYISPEWVVASMEVQSLLTVCGSACIFLAAPAIIRRVWDTQPLPTGALRDMLIRMCRLHEVRVRELLLWNTFGGMINAAVMGIVAPFRYILLTDALLEHLPQRQVEAVMAHELAHVRRHHFFWLIIMAAGVPIAVLLTIETVVGTTSMVDEVYRGSLGPHGQRHVEVAVMLGFALAWFLSFGWVSRRFERQADSFAVQHLTRTRTVGDDTVAVVLEGANPGPGSETSRTATIGGAKAELANEADNTPQSPDGLRKVMRIVDESVDTMANALLSVAKLNHMSLAKESIWDGIRHWRHGSIRWRHNYLHSLNGLPIDRLPIDRQVRTLKLIATALILIGFACKMFVE